MSNEHGIIALSWHNIISTGNSEFIPSEYLENLHKGYITSIARNTKIYTLLKEVLKIADENGIKIIFLKGLAHEILYYGNKGLRQMNDLDLLVKKEDALKFRKILMEEGFDSMPMISPLHEKFLPNYGKHLPEMYRNGLTVEIHFDIFRDTGKPQPSEIFPDARELEIMSGWVLCLSPVYNFLYLVSHLYHHEEEGYSQLRLYTDLVMILQMESFYSFSNIVIKEAEKLNLSKPMKEKMTVLHSFWSLESFSNQDISENIDCQAIERFLSFLESPIKKPSETGGEEGYKEFRNIPGVFNKAVFALGSMFPSLSLMKYRYRTKPRIASVLYYPVRWVTLLKKFFS